jgi:hypothetical protein
MPNAKKTQLASLLAICAGALVAAAPAVAAGGGDEVGPGGLPKKLLLVYRHADQVDFSQTLFGGPTTIQSHTTRSFSLDARIPLTLSKAGTAKGHAPLKYKKADYTTEFDTTTDAEDLHCKKHETDTAVSTTGSTATASLKVGRPKGKRKIGPITLSFNPGHPAETVHINDRVLEGDCPSAGEYTRQENLYLGAFQTEWGLSGASTNITVKTIKPIQGSLVSGRLATPYPDREDGSYKDEFLLLKR